MDFGEIFKGMGSGQKNNQLDFGSDPDHRLGLQIWITIWIQKFLKDSLFTTAIPTESHE